MRKFVLPVFVVLLGYIPFVSTASAKSKTTLVWLMDAAKSNVKGGPANIVQELSAALKTRAEKSKHFVMALPEGYPDPKTDPEGFRKRSTADKLSVYRVLIELDAFSQTVENVAPPKEGLQVKTSVTLHIFGEVVPGNTMGFTADGDATIILEVGKKVSENDKKAGVRETLEEAAQAAIDNALAKLAGRTKK